MPYASRNRTQHNQTNHVLVAFRRDVEEMAEIGWSLPQTAESWDDDAIESFADMYSAEVLEHARKVIRRLGPQATAVLEPEAFVVLDAADVLANAYQAGAILARASKLLAEPLDADAVLDSFSEGFRSV
jgi:hypothetical protein